MAQTLTELLKDAPQNWGRWGADDELGSLNFLTQAEVLRGVRAVQNGKVFTLQVRMCHPDGDPGYKGRSQPSRMMVMDKGHYLSGKAQPFPGGIEYADDVMMTNLQATTQYDALGHVWFDDKLYNGYDARTTMGGGLSKDSILPVAERGVVGRGVLLDVARYKNLPHLSAGYGISLDELHRTAEHQKLTIEKHDILLIRTGWLNRFFTEGPAAYYGENATDESPDTAVQAMSEPGIAYSPELVPRNGNSQPGQRHPGQRTNVSPRVRLLCAAPRGAHAQSRCPVQRNQLARRPGHRLCARRPVRFSVCLHAAQDFRCCRLAD
ncbi:MAG: cyclase family protein [Desulfurellaceae bacterium]|nr:cyclase family protein [Desulfurellaceae bacterium]